MDWKLGGLILGLAALAGCDLTFVGDHMKVRQAKSDVASAMRDPDSATFRDVELIPVDTSHGSAVCGQVNGTNAFGAKAGFQNFIYVQPLLRIADSAESNRAIGACCRHLASAEGSITAKNTAEIPECAEIHPAMPLVL